MWKLVRENGFLWKGKYDGNGNWVWRIAEDDLILERLRENWQKFNDVANGDATHSILPKWAKTKTPSAKTSGFDDFDDDIPF